MSFQRSPPEPPLENQSRDGLRGFPQIAGYELDREIGRGGIATVYRATQQSLQRQVAIKVLMQELDDSSEMARRFKKEGHILAQLLHPNIVTIYDVGITENNHLYLSIEYLSGGTLQERIQRGLSVDSAIYIIRCIAKALGYAHRKGVIHRDIKPSNIMFRYDDTPVLTDFGVARITKSNTIHTALGLIIGSPGYMSPEQTKGENVTFQSDLYGLGVVLYEMLMGQPLYQADNSLAVMFKHLHDPIPSLPLEYAHLQPILDKLLAKKNVDRYRSAGEFLRALNLIIPSDTGSQSEWNTGNNNSLGVIDLSSGKLQSLLRAKPQRSTWIGIIGATILTAAIGYTFQSRNTVNTTPMEQPQAVEQTPLLSREAEIAALLKQADAQLKAGLSSDEAEQSTEAAYRRVLKLDRNNAQALAGLENMVKAYEQSAQQHLQAGAPQNSLEQIGKGLAMAPGRIELLKLRQEAEQQIAELKAKKMEQERREEMRLQAGQLLFNAQSAFQEGLLEISLAHIEQGLLAVPRHPSLLALREQVKERILERQRQAEAQQRRKVEARRQAEEAEQQKAERMRRLRESDQFLAQALELQRGGKYIESLQQIEKGLTLIPDHLELTQLRDQVRTQQAEYAKREQEIKTLLQQAEAHFKAGRLTEPTGGNAEQIYRRIITQLDAGNAPAQAGLAKIAQNYLQKARQRYEIGALSDSLILIDKGLALVPEQANLVQLREEVSRKIAEIKTRQQREQEQQAQAGQLLIQAQHNVQEGRLEAGLAFIEQGLSVVPNHRKLSVLHEQVKVKIAQQQREAEAKQKAAEAERQKVAEAERQKVEAAQRQAEEMKRQKAEQLRKQAEAEQRRREADHWLIQAMDSQHGGKYTDSLQQINKGLALVPDHRELIQLREQILTRQAEEKKQQAEQKHNEEIKKLLEQAEEQFKAGQLTEPTGNNAEATYRKLLKLDTDNVQAQTGLARIAQDYLQQAQRKKAVGDWRGSLKLIEKGLTVMPNQADLVRLQEEIRTQTTIEQQKLDRQRQEEEQRQKQQVEQQKEKRWQEEERRQEDQKKKIEQQLIEKKGQEQQRQEQQRLEQQRREEKRLKERQNAEQQRLEQQRLEQKQQEQQQEVERQRLERQRKEQQRLEQQRLEQQRQEQHRKMEQQRQEQQHRELQPEKQPVPEPKAQPRVFGTF